jgi:GNAT superfamily N-acetyltransferase
MSEPKLYSPLRLRSALPDDAPRLTEIAFAAKRYWGYPERWIALWREQLIITQDYVRNHQVVLAEVDSGAAGFYALTISDSKADLDYLWVDPPHIGQGIGRALVEHACRTASSLGAARMELIADPNAEGFYRRMGADKIGESVYELEGQVRRLPLMEIRLDTRDGG